MLSLIPVVFFGDDAEELIHQEPVTIHVKKQGADYKEFESQITDDLSMKDIALVGNVSPGSYTQELEMKVRKFKFIDLEEDDSIDQLIDDME